MEMLVQKIHEAVSNYCQKQAEDAQRGYAQAAWFEQNGQEQIKKELESEKFAGWFGKAQELGYDVADIKIKPYMSTRSVWYSWTSFNLTIDIYGDYTSFDRFHFPKDSELPKNFIIPFLEREQKESAEKYRQRQAEVAERDRLAAEEKAKADAEKKVWIAEFGSDYLKRATALDYNCQRQYVTERAAHEHPDYTVDFDSDADWNDRACPSMDALEEVEALVAAGVNAEVVWLTSPTHRSESYEDEANWESREAIVIRDYIGKYDLVKEI